MLVLKQRQEEDRKTVKSRTKSLGPHRRQSKLFTTEKRYDKCSRLKSVQDVKIMQIMKPFYDLKGRLVKSMIYH